MKNNILLFAIIFSYFSANSQKIKEKSITSKVKSATIFLNNAQVTRIKEVKLDPGIQLLKFIGLSPFIDKKSIQIKAKNIEIQAVNFKKNYLSKNKKSIELISLEKKLNFLDKEIEKENVNLLTTQEKIRFFKENRSIRGSQTLTVIALKETAQFYGDQMNLLNIKELNSNNTLKRLQREKKLVTKQLEGLTIKNSYFTGEIIVKVTSDLAKNTDFQLIYNVSNVSWYPTYDVRVTDINSPLTIVYKANVKQNSKVDWNNVKLQFSSANPNQSTKAGKITPYFIGYGTRPPNYKNNIDEISGYVSDNKGNLPGVSVIVKGTTIGTETNFDGKYSIKIPNSKSTLVFSYLGYKTEERLTNNSTINVTMQENNVSLDEIVVTARGIKREKKVLGYSASYIKTGKKDSNYSIPTEEIVNQTSVSFKIIEPYTIKSSNKDYVVSMKTYQTDATYIYYTVPRIEERAFLVASLKNWEQYNLLEGEASIYFEDTFIGTSLIDTRFTKNNLDISLGVDKNITVKRTKSKDFTTKQFIGNKKEETSLWDIAIKNNKKQSIKIIILDQIPISTREEITITLDKSFNGELDKKTGEIKWLKIINSNDIEEFQLKYTARYPKNEKLLLD
ncbi:mucoidy inhibitor MuiA family protein [Flavobacteriaceae bacterium]|nr:mucoidy inhibitor MuiA family protein [Flavobacteriaceae bacterium]